MENLRLALALFVILGAASGRETTVPPQPDNDRNRDVKCTVSEGERGAEVSLFSGPSFKVQGNNEEREVFRAGNKQFNVALLLKPDGDGALGVTRRDADGFVAEASALANRGVALIVKRPREKTTRFTCILSQT